MKKKIKVVAYCRVSTGSEEQYNSFKNQKQFFERYVKEHPEFELVKTKDCPTGIYADRGISGTLFHREQFENMLRAAGLNISAVDYKSSEKKDADGNPITITYRDYLTTFSNKNPEFSLILVKNTSRFARNILITDILRKLEQNRVYVKFIDIDKSTENPEDLSIISFFQIFDEMFSRDLSRKLISANIQSRENQILRSNNQLYGYKYHKRKSRAENNKLTIIEEEAKIIRIVYRCYFGCLQIDTSKSNKQNIPQCDFKCSECKIRPTIKMTEGLGPEHLTRLLNDYFKVKTRKGVPFVRTSIRHILENEKYGGMLNNGKFNHGTVFNYYSTPRYYEDYKERMVFRPDLIPPIISYELFKLCEEKRIYKAGSSLGVFKGKPTEYAGLLYCGKCGEVMTHNMSNDNKGYYNCKTKKKKGSKFCNNGNLFDFQLKEFIKELCESRMAEIVKQKNYAVFNHLISTIREKLDFISRNRDTNVVSELRQEIANKEQQLTNLYIKESQDGVNKNALQGAILQLQSEVEELQKKFEKLAKKPVEIIVECEELLNILNILYNEETNPKEKYTEEEVLSIISRFTIWSETNYIKGGLKGTPIVEIIPTMKYETTLSVTYGIDIDNIPPLPMGTDTTHYLNIMKNEIDKISLDLELLKGQY